MEKKNELKKYKCVWILNEQDNTNIDIGKHNNREIKIVSDQINR